MYKRGLIVFIVLLIVLAGCKTKEQPKEEPKAVWLIWKDIELKTEDNVGIKADHYVNPSGKGVILLHMFGKDRTSWQGFAEYLQSNGYNALTVDLRGHGRSELKYTDFKEEDFNKMVLDVKAAKKYFNEKNINNIAIVGASIGANTALNYALNDKEIKTIVLLSPGENYKGIKVQNDLTKFFTPTLIVVAEGDEYSFKSGLKIMDSTNAKKSIKIYKGTDAHGTDMFKNTDLKPVILDWLNKNT